MVNSSKDGFMTKVWGPGIWMFLHMISLNYDPTKPGMKRGTFEFLKNLRHVLPCGACRDNYSNIILKDDKLKLTNDVMKSRESLSKWLFLVHNRVQRDIFTKTKNSRNKPIYSDSNHDYITAMQFYEQFRAKCMKNSYGCTTPLIGNIRKKSTIKISEYKNFNTMSSIRVAKKSLKEQRNI